MVSFSEAYLLDSSVGGPHHRVIKRRNLDEGKTAKVMAKLRKGRNILGECRTEARRLSRGARAAL